MIIKLTFYMIIKHTFYMIIKYTFLHNKTRILHDNKTHFT